MAREMDEEQLEYEVVDLEVLKDLDHQRLDKGHRAETWEEARERVGRLPEPERSQQFAWLNRLQNE